MTTKSGAKPVSTCEICGRELILGQNVDLHHLIPKTFKGTETILIHRICHTKIHSLFTERELLHHYHTAERLRSHPEMEKFIRWLRNKAPEFKAANRPSKSKGLRKG
jgi:hypothetical protein